MSDIQHRVLTHIPLLRIPEDVCPFAHGTLRRLPFDEFDDLMLGAFHDSEKRFRVTQPAFFEEIGDVPVVDAVTPYGIAAALNLAVPARGFPRPDLSLRIDVGGPHTGTLQGASDLELLFHQLAPGRALSPEELDVAARMVPIVQRATDAQTQAMATLIETAGPSLGMDERLTLCAIELEALVSPEQLTDSRKAFVRRLTNLVGGAEEDEVRSLADAIYRARTQSVHRRPGPRSRLDPAARCLLARVVIALDGADLDELRGRLDDERPDPGGVPFPALDWSDCAPPGPFMSLPPPASLPATWHPERPAVGTEQAVAFFPLVGCDAEWPPIPGFPLTRLTAGQLTGLEEPDVARDWISRVQGCACLALTRRAAEHATPGGGSSDIEALKPLAGLAVLALRLAGVSNFVDPELLGDFALTHGSLRYRRGTVFRQTAMLRGQARQSVISRRSAPDLEAAWWLLLDYDGGEHSAVIDEVLVLFRRAHDSVSLPTDVRLQLLFGAYELMADRVPFPDQAHPIDALRASMSDPAPLDWLRRDGRMFRNSVAHGYWDRGAAPQALAHLLALVAALIPRFIAAWLDASRPTRPDRTLRQALQRGTPADWRRSSPPPAKAAADSFRYDGLDIPIDLAHAQQALDAGDSTAARAHLGRAVAAMPAAQRLPAPWLSAIHRLALIERDSGDLARARDLLARAAGSGFTAAMTSLGVLERRQANHAAARRWYLRAAEAGDRSADFNLALMEEDLGRLEDAERHYRLAAESGRPEAMNNLACMLTTGRRSAEGLEWFRRAADAGHPGAMFTVGDLARRSGDRSLARDWWSRAARAGNERAAAALRSPDLGDQGA